MSVSAEERASRRDIPSCLNCRSRIGARDDVFHCQRAPRSKSKLAAPSRAREGDEHLTRNVCFPHCVRRPTWRQDRSTSSKAVWSLFTLMMSPPFLVIRPARAFWIERRPPLNATATPHAFADGCYSRTRWYDSAGGAWTVTSARVKRRPSLFDRALQRPVAVELDFGPREEADVAEALTRLREVLRNDNEFCDDFRMSIADISAQFESAHTPADLIAVASRLK